MLAAYYLVLLENLHLDDLVWFYTMLSIVIHLFLLYGLDDGTGKVSVKIGPQARENNNRAAPVNSDLGATTFL